MHFPAQQSKALTIMAATSPVKSPSSPASLPQIPSLAKYKLGEWRRRGRRGKTESTDAEHTPPSGRRPLRLTHAFVASSFTVFLGDQGVGKTSIITRFMYDTFEKNYQVRLCPGVCGAGLGEGGITECCAHNPLI